MRTDLTWHGPELAWEYFEVLLKVRGEVRKNFYYDMCVKHGWSVNELRERIRDMYYEDIIYPV